MNQTFKAYTCTLKQIVEVGDDNVLWENICFAKKIIFLPVCPHKVINELKL